MSATGLEVFDKTLQMTNIWLEEIESTPVPTGALPGIACKQYCEHSAIGYRRNWQHIWERNSRCSCAEPITINTSPQRFRQKPGHSMPSLKTSLKNSTEYAPWTHSSR